MCQLCMGLQMAELAVDRHEVFRSDQGMHQLQFLLACVSRNMYIRDVRIDYFCALFHQLVDYVCHRQLVARYR